MSELLCATPCEGVEVLTLSSPERRNALDLGLLAELAEAIRGTEARAVVIRGEAPAFSSGYDLRSLPPADGDDFVAGAEALVANPDHDAFAAIESSPATVIAAIDGVALGGGLELAVSCDLRLAATGSRLAMPARDLGLVYSHTGVRRFLRACGETVTAELFLAARSYDAEEALRVGLIGETVEPEQLDERTLEIATAAASAPAATMRDNKRLIRTLAAQADPAAGQAESELRTLRQQSLAAQAFRDRVAAFTTRTRTPGASALS
jgi:enoyl-CoA hydratase/carnithine racemase